MLGVKLPLLVLPVLLSACATSGFVVERELMIERKLNLPPEPNIDMNNATILGVDVNKNNIRDDVERKIAFDLYDDPSEMKRHMRYAQIWTEVFLAKGNKSKILELDNEISNNLRCPYLDVKNNDEFYKKYDVRYNSEKLLNNSKKRKEAYWAAKKIKMTEFRILPKRHETEKYCAQFNK